MFMCSICNTYYILWSNCNLQCLGVLNVSLPDSEPSVIGDYLSQPPPSLIAGFVQHLAELLHQRLLQQAEPGGPVQSIRHGVQPHRFTFDVFSPGLESLVCYSLELISPHGNKSDLLPERNLKERYGNAHFAGLFPPYKDHPGHFAKGCVRVKIDITKER